LSAPNSVPYLPQPEFLAPQVIDVDEYDAELRMAAKALRVSSMRIAYYGWRMKLSDGWVRFGLEPGPRGEEAYRESIGVPKSSWYRLIRVGQSLHQLPLADLERISVTNAEILLAVSPTILHDYSWVHEARTLSSTQLAALVTERNRTAGDTREPLTLFTASIPFLAKQAINEMLDTFKDKNLLSSRGQALELLIADRCDRPNLLAATEKAMRLLQGALGGLKAKKIEAPDELYWLQLAMEALNEARKETVQAARSQSNGGQEGGGA